MKITNRPRVLACLGLLACLFAVAIPAQTVPASAYAQMSWRLVGPFDGGRVLAVAGVPTQPQTYYFGSANGGVWKTTNSGLSWEPLFNDQPVSSIGAIAVAPSDPNIIYVGTGEADPRSDLTFGDGVYKSTDAGKTWTNIGLRKTLHIGKIVVDPHDPNVVLVAALGRIYGPSEDRGIYRSSDGGRTWTKTLYVNDKTGGIDVAMDPSNPSVLYAGMWTVQRTPWHFSSGGEGDGLFKSTDQGKTWVRLQGHGLPTGVLGKIGVAVAGGETKGQVVYAIIEAKDGGLFRSDNGGGDWKLVSNDQRIMGRAWYFMNVFVDPVDANTVYATNTGFFKSTDGGHSWNALVLPGGDNHAFWINPLHPHLMVQGHDQGVVTSVDGGKTWGKYYNLPIAQLYHISADDRFPYNIYGSVQDCPSGCAFGTASRGVGGITSKDVFNVGGDDGESGYVFADPNDPNYIVEGGYGGALTRYSLRTRTIQDIAPWSNANGGHAAKDTKYRFTWTSPFAFASWKDGDSHPLYMGSQYLMVSHDSGKSWSVISQDLTRNDKSKQQSSGGPITQDNASVEYYNVIYAIAPSPVSKGQIWIGTDDGLVWLTRDAGKTYKKITPPKMPEWARIDAIEASHFDAGTAFVVADAHKLGDNTPYVFVTHDYGATWSSLVDGLSAPNYVYVVRQDPVNENLLFAGTANGIMVSFNGGRQWQSLQLNLPTSQVRDIAIKGADLLVATHGRSAWAMDDISALRQLSAEVMASPAHLFASAPAWLLRMRDGRSTGAGNLAGENPPNDVIAYYLKEKPSGKITLAIYDAAGNLVNSFDNVRTGTVEGGGEGPFARHPLGDKTLTDHPGINRFVWDLRFPAAPPIHAKASYVEGRGPNGAYVVPGTYKLVLTVEGQSYTQPLLVKADPRSTATQADLVKQFNLASKAQNLLWQNHAVINQILDLRAQLQTLQEKDGTSKLIRQQASALDGKVFALQGELYQYHAATGVGLLNYPVKLGERIAYLSNEVNLMSAAAPTRQFYAQYDEYEQAMAPLLQRWQSLQDRDLSALNAKLQAGGLPALVIANGAEERMPGPPVQIH
jgi:photosystem II stability/assembly factor-like uncharacterized protein